jgi:hypothetical protein
MTRAAYPIPPVYIPSCSHYFGAAGARACGISPSGASGSVAWPTANLAIYHPFYLPCEYPLRRLWWANGSTSGGDMDIGVYSSRGTLIIKSGTTARDSGALSTLQYVSVDYILPPGGYYLGQVCSATTGMIQSIAGSWTAAAGRACGLLQESLGSASLPAVMTPATFAQTLVPLAGLTLSPTW